MRPGDHRPLRALALGAALLCALVPDAARAAEATALVDAALVAEPVAATPGTPFTAAVRLRVPEGWHLSWRNPGDAGLVPTLRWELPPGVSAGPIEWPVPHLSTLGPVTIYALDGEVWLLVELVPARALPLDRPLLLAVNAEWLVCKELCVPEKARLELVLPLSAGRAPSGAQAAGFLSARARLPRSLGWRATLGKQDLKAGTAELSIDTSALPLSLPGARVTLFPDEPGALDPAADQEPLPHPGGLTLTLHRPRGARAPLEQLSGVLVVQGNDEGDQVAAAISTAPPPPAPARLPIWLALIFAFAGGLLLNLMPCVLPVLGFKVLSLIRDAGAGARRARIGGLAYAAGVIASFWILAAVLLALRASGRALGWGFQLQSPAVVALLSLLYFLLGLSFLGVLQFGAGLQSRAGALRFSAGGWGAFASGVLATTVATPCTAPFMGVALGAALVSPAPVTLSIFTALGVGMAWPYALLSLWPALLRRVPKPGAWTVRLQQALAFPLFATVLWLLSVLSAQAGQPRVLATLGALLIAAFALWLWRSAGGPEATALRRRLAGLAALTLGALAVWGAASPAALLGGVAGDRVESASLPSSGAGGADGEDGQVAWIDWTPERFAQLRGEGRFLFVDFTAAWCISCQVNERLVFSSPAVRARFARLGVVPLRADWTRADPAITRALESFGRSGVPLNLFVGPGAKEPLLLPPVLTTGMVLDALEQVARR